jgi:BirA family transcriptional regulator, biotin operon repressor / biotin---[acetyl-CoA-carboxylase] ligase
MIGSPLIRLDSVSSTQDVVFRLAERGAPEGTTVLARYQSGGRGRAGRVWTAAPGEALLFSLLLRPPLSPDRLAPMSILVADAIAETLSSEFSLQPFIKWPNDVLLDGRKVSGVLIQARGDLAVIGVGINSLSKPEDLPDGATSIRAESGHDVNPESVFRSVVCGIEVRYRALLSGMSDALVQAVNERLWLRGREVTVSDAGQPIAGTVLRVRPDGALLLETAEGERVVVSGELTRGPRASMP